MYKVVVLGQLPTFGVNKSVGANVLADTQQLTRKSSNVRPHACNKQPMALGVQVHSVNSKDLTDPHPVNNCLRPLYKL